MRMKISRISLQLGGFLTVDVSSEIRMNTEYCYNHKKDTRAGTCHYDIIDPIARFVVGWSEYSPFLLSPFTLHPSLYIPDFATPSVQPFRVAFLTDISVKLSETSFSISAFRNPKNVQIHV